MKKIIAIISIGVVIFSFSATIFGQDLKVEIRKAGSTENVSGQTLKYTITTSDIPTSGEGYYIWEKAKFHVYNKSGANRPFRIKRIRVEVPNDWLDNLCWPPLCYDDLNNKELNGYFITPSSTGNPAPIIEDNSTKVVGGAADGSVAEIKPQVFPKQPGSKATYKYIVSDVSGTTDIDSITIEISYIVDPDASKPEDGTSSISNSSVSASELILSPNPASDYVYIQADGILKGSIRIVDVLGNVVYSGGFDSNKKLSTSNYKNGIYFVSVQDSSTKTITKKLVVRN